MNEPVNLGGTVIVRHLGADGKPKPIFQENAMFSWLIQHGWLSPNAWKIPILFGRWQAHKEIRL